MRGLHKLDAQHFFLYQELESKNEDVRRECYEQIIHFQNILIKKINEKFELIHNKLSEQNFEISILKEGMNLTHREAEKNTAKIVKLSEDVLKVKGRLCKLEFEIAFITDKFSALTLKD